MDITNHIREQVLLIRRRTSKIDLSGLIVHLERAEYFYNEGRAKQDDNFFTDVIYRTNQIYEGALREAYNILSESVNEKINKKRINTIDIENYFIKHDILNKRVVMFFGVYRENWRNESTHNYRLFFNESEALMAINTVSSFAYVLINQILEALAFQVEKTKNLNANKLIKQIHKSDYSFEDKIISVINAFIAMNKEIIENDDYREVEIIGLFNGFLNTIAKNIFQIRREPVIVASGQELRPDFILNQENNEHAIIEFKSRRIEKDIDSVRSQMIRYLMLSNINIGVIFYFKRINVDEVKIERNILHDVDKTFKIIEVY